MKRIILSMACALSLASCGSPPHGANPNMRNENIQTEEKLLAPTIKVFVENSGSMDGYVKGSTDFENAIYSFLSDIQHADLGDRTDSLATKNTLILNYINSEIIQQKLDIREFIETMEPADFIIKGGKRGTSDMSNILGTIISQTNDNEVSILVSDCIFSPGRKYKTKGNADEYIVAQQIGIKNHIIEKLANNPNFSIVVMRLISQFNGIYYNKFDDRQPINNDRPFFIWLMGDRNHLNNIIKQIKINQIKGKGVQNIFMIHKALTTIPYSISLPKPGNGKYEIARSEVHTISNAKTEGKGGNSRFKIEIPVDFSKVLLPDEYLMNPNNYIISNKAYGFEITKYTGPNKKRYTHTITLSLIQPLLSKGNIKITLLNSLPQWINEYTDESGLNINASGAMEKTYGLRFLLEGVYDAYSSNREYGSITINIK